MHDVQISASTVAFDDDATNSANRRSSARACARLREPGSRVETDCNPGAVSALFSLCACRTR